MAKCTESTNWKSALARTCKTLSEQKIEREQQYLLSPNACRNCNSVLDYDKRRLTFCNQSCAATYNNKKFPKRIRVGNIVKGKKGFQIVFKPRQYICMGCGILFDGGNRTRKYCSNNCQTGFRWKIIVSQIEDGNITLRHVNYRKYLIEKYGAKCSLCGWDKVNSTSNTVPIELDHIDGNSENNQLTNLRLVCPNCHSLQSTYKGLNKGNGRHSRMIRYRAGKSF